MLIKLLACAVAGAILARLELTGDDMNLVYSKADTRLVRAIEH